MRLIDKEVQFDKLVRYLINNSLVNMDDMLDENVADEVIKVFAAQAAQIERLREVEKAAESYDYWVDVYFETRVNASPLIMIESEKEANAARRKLKKALSAARAAKGGEG